MVDGDGDGSDGGDGGDGGDQASARPAVSEEQLVLT
jgi:hypothetical protein